MKTAIVTGASGGIGSATVLSLLENEYYVVAFYNTNESGINDLIRKAEKIEKRDYLHTIRADFSSTVSIKSGFDLVPSFIKHIDLLVNNAGVSLIKQSVDTTEEEFDRVFAVNMKSVFTLTNLVLPGMIERKSGCIINISSVWGEVGASLETVYSASKSAVIGYTKALSKELAPSQIRVNCICPGVIDTKMNDCFTEEERREIIAEIPLGRMGRAEEIVSLINYLVTAEYTTGQVLVVDGGYAK